MVCDPGYASDRISCYRVDLDNAAVAVHADKAGAVRFHGELAVDIGCRQQLVADLAFPLGIFPEIADLSGFQVYKPVTSLG